MRGAYAIARHEFLRRWPLVLVGLGLGLVSRAFTSPGTQFADALVMITVVACWFIAFTTGLSLIGRPLHDGRLSFYFTRPITSSGIAIGKIAGGLVAVACMHIALVVPCRAFSNADAGDFSGPATFIGIAFFVVGLVVGILARSRSRWLVADVAGAALAAVIAVAMFAGFGARKSAIAQFADPADAQALLHQVDSYLDALVVAAAIALLISVVVGVMRGRTDRDLVHRWLSITLWPALTAIGLVGIAVAEWGLS
jgi:hypothetical protein